MHIAISRGLARYLEEVEGFDDASFEIVHYGIEPDGAPSRTRTACRVLLCVGRLIPIKGHIVLLRAFAAARASVPDLELEIAGRGPLEPALKALGDGARRARLDPVPRPRLAGAARDRATRRSSSSRRWAKASAWSRSRRWSARAR